MGVMKLAYIIITSTVLTDNILAWNPEANPALGVGWKLDGNAWSLKYSDEEGTFFIVGL